MERPERPVFGDDLTIDAADREYLDNLPELERETIMNERWEQMQRYKEAMRIYEKHQAESQASTLSSRRRRRESPVPDTQPAPSNAAYSRTSEKLDLSSLVARAEPLRVDIVPVAPSSSAIAAVEPDRGLLEDFRSICLSRDKAAAVFASLAPAAMVDCIVRLPWPQTGGYELSFVSRVLAEERKFVVKISGKFVTVPLMSVSNSPPSEKEISDFLATIDFDAGGAKRKAVEISLALEQRQPVNLRHLNPTLEMARLTDELEIEKTKLRTAIGNSSDGDSIRKKIARLQQDMETVRKLLDEHKKRKFESNRNFVPTRSREEIFKSIKTTTEEISGSQQVLNPFKRRECAPTVMWDVGKNSKKISGAEVRAASRSRSPDRTGAAIMVARKEKFSVLRDMENLDLLATIDLSSFLDRLESANISDIRFREHQRSAQRAFPRTLDRLWEKLRVPISVQHTETMTLDEWRTRVQEAQTSL
jgi:hypothetical protein